VAHVVAAYLRLALEMQELWLATRIRRRDHWLTRLNPLALEPLEPDPALLAYWRRTHDTIVRLQLWRLNPFALTWNIVRGTRRTLIFLLAIRGQRY
jgi:hypothetical protein